MHAGRWIKKHKQSQGGPPFILSTHLGDEHHSARPAPAPRAPAQHAWDTASVSIYVWLGVLRIVDAGALREAPGAHSNPRLSTRALVASRHAGGRGQAGGRAPQRLTGELLLHGIHLLHLLVKTHLQLVVLGGASHTQPAHQHIKTRLLQCRFAGNTPFSAIPRIQKNKARPWTVRPSTDEPIFSETGGSGVRDLLPKVH